MPASPATRTRTRATLGGGDDRRPQDRELSLATDERDVVLAHVDPQCLQILVRWKFWNDREGVGPRWPW